MNALVVALISCAALMAAVGLTLGKTHHNRVPSNVVGKVLFVPPGNPQQEKEKVPSLRPCLLQEISKEYLITHLAHRMGSGSIVVIASDGVCVMRPALSLDDEPNTIACDFIRGETNGEVAGAHALLVGEEYTDAGCEGEDSFYFAQIIEEAAP